jgi:predicted MFS family arabinose efflux permease
MSGVSFLGLVLGPAVGATASSVGRQPTFAAVGLSLIALALWSGPRHDTHEHAVGERSSLGSFCHPALAIPIAAIFTMGALIGTLSALGPLVLSDHGLGANAIAATMAVACAPLIVLLPLLGRRLGPSGALQFSIVAMLSSALLVALVPVPESDKPAIALFAAAFLASITLFNPLLLLTSATADRLGRSQGMAMSLANGAWGFGSAAGAFGFARLADTTSIADAFLAVGACALGTAAVLILAARVGLLSPGAPD